MELEKSALSEALSRIQKLENELALSRIQTDQSEKEKQDLTAIIKSLNDKFINPRLDYLIDQLDSNVSVLNEITENMKRAECNDENDLISLCSDDEEIVDDRKPFINEPDNEDEKLVSVTKSLNRVQEYIQKICVQKICDDEDPIIIDDVKYNDVIFVSDDDSDGSDVQCISHSPKFKTTAVIELDESSTLSDNEDCVFLSYDSSLPPSSNSNLHSIMRSSFTGVFQKQAHKKEKHETPASSNTKEQPKNYHDVSQKPVSFENGNASNVVMKEENTLRDSPTNNAPRLQVKQERDSCPKHVLPKSFSVELYKLPIEMNEQDNLNENVGANVVICSKSNPEEHSSTDISPERSGNISDRSLEDVLQETTSPNVEATPLHVSLNQDPDTNVIVCSKSNPEERSSPDIFHTILNQWIENSLPENSPNIEAASSHVDNLKKDTSQSTEKKILCNVLQKKKLVNYDESDSSNQSTLTTTSESSAKNSKINRQSKLSSDETLSASFKSDDSSSDIFDSENDDSTTPTIVQHTAQSKTSSSITSYRKKCSYDDEQNADISESESVSDNSTTSSNKQTILVGDHFLNTSRRKQSFSSLNADSDSSSTSTDPQIISVRRTWNNMNSKRLKIDQQRGENFSILLKREIIDVDDETDASPQETSAKKQKKSDHSYHYDLHSHLPDSKSSLFQEMRIKNRLPIIPCQFCDECFGDPWRYSKHLNSKHVGDKRVFTCSICNFVTTTVALHRRHVTKFHGDLFLLGSGSGPEIVQNLKKDHAYAV